MDRSTAVLFCQSWLKAWTGNCPDELIRFYADNIYYQDPAKPTGIKGKDALLQYFQKLLAKYPDWIWNMVEIFPYEGGFTLKWEARLSSQTNTDSFFGLDIVEINNGQITRNEVYFDPKLLMFAQDKNHERIKT